MLCPRCGNEWDASRSSCANCGFRPRIASPAAATTNPSDQLQRGGMSSSQTLTPNQQPGSIPMAKQQYSSTPGAGSALTAPNLRPMNTATSRPAWPTSRQNSGSMPAVRPQTEGLRDQPLPNTPRPLSPASPSLIPPRGSGLHASRQPPTDESGHACACGCGAPARR